MPAHVRNKYGPTHKAERRAWAPHVAQGIIHCWRCGQRITTNQDWDLGHRDGRPSHPEHASCNRTAGAAYGNTKREPRTDIW